MSSTNFIMSRHEAEELLYREALLLDRGDWAGWLGLYTEDCALWVPGSLGADTPQSPAPLIRYQGRAALQERIAHLQGGPGPADRRPGVVHSISNVLVEHAEGDHARVCASAIAHLHDPAAARSQTLFARYDYALRRIDQAWRIASKTIVLVDEPGAGEIDFYTV